MVRAGILTPEHVPTTVYVTSTDADLVTALKVEMPLQIAASGSPPLASFCQALGLGLG